MFHYNSGWASSCSSLQKGYVGPPNANVVREGDTFEFIPSEGSVRHEFGQKRGQILGAYAMMHHKQFRPVAVFVDFQEYFQANSGELNNRYGNKNVWDRMPSAMIQKIAEVFVLRRQFPWVVCTPVRKCHSKKTTTVIAETWVFQ